MRQPTKAQLKHDHNIINLTLDAITAAIHDMPKSAPKTHNFPVGGQNMAGYSQAIKDVIEVLQGAKLNAVGTYETN